MSSSKLKAVSERGKCVLSKEQYHDKLRVQVERDPSMVGVEFDNPKNKWGFPEVTEEDGTVKHVMPPAESIGVELYAVDQKEGTFGIRVVLPAGRTHEMYEGDDVYLCAMESVIARILQTVAFEKLCVEVEDYHGEISDTTEMTHEGMLMSMLSNLAESGQRERYEELKEAGAIPGDMAFETFKELDDLKNDEDGPTIH